jgi:uncharacterized protein HemY
MVDSKWCPASLGKQFKGSLSHYATLLVNLKGVHYPAALRAWDSSSNKFQCAALLKFGTHYVKHKEYSEAQQ